MSAQTLTQQVRWQDFAVMKEIDIVLEIARQKGWKDCEIFGHGDMITQPQDLKGWKLIPADLYEYSIPAESVSRVHQVINAGVRIQGIIIADDERGTAPVPTQAPTSVRPRVSLQPIQRTLSSVGKALLVMVLITVGIACVGLIAVTLIKITPLFLLAPLFLIMGAGKEYDPKLIILVDDGSGGAVWISLFTWFE
jgi:hypothetical protein